MYKKYLHNKLLKELTQIYKPEKRKKIIVAYEKLDLNKKFKIIIYLGTYLNDIIFFSFTFYIEY